MGPCAGWRARSADAGPRTDPFHRGGRRGCEVMISGHDAAMWPAGIGGPAVAHPRSSAWIQVRYSGEPSRIGISNGKFDRCMRIGFSVSTAYPSGPTQAPSRSASRMTPVM